MWRLIVRVLFKQQYRRTPSRKGKLAGGSGVYKTDRETGSTYVRRRPANPPAQTAASVFDVETAHPVTQPRVIEGPAFVTDGDTITIQRTQIRLYGIDAPELNHPFGKKAKWTMVRLCKGQRIRAEVTEEDGYGRTVAKCFLPDGRDLSAEMVKLGLAIDWPKFSGGQYGHLEITGARKKLWLADARQKGRMHVWDRFAAKSKPPE